MERPCPRTRPRTRKYRRGSQTQNGPGRLAEFWKKGSLSLKTRLLLYTALIMAKIVYALESLPLPDRLLDKLNTFHLRGLRQLLGMKTTLVRRGNTNAMVLKRANEYMNAIPPNTHRNRNLLNKSKSSWYQK